jgi:hypothetical protein
VFEYLSATLRGAVEWVLQLYRDVDFAYGVAATMVLLAAVLVSLAAITHLLRTTALQRRQRQISSFINFASRVAGRDSGDDRESQFASRFREIDAEMQRSDGFSAPLALAWRRYRKTLSFVGAPPIRSTQRPAAFFYSAMPPPTWLGFAANMFVAFGLLATFLGLVAALTFASEGMASDDIGAMQLALRDLLNAAASKFVTSIAGVGLSIVLRVTERVLTLSLRSRLDQLSNAMEFGIRVDSDAHSAAVAERIGQLVGRIETSSVGIVTTDPA